MNRRRDLESLLDGVGLPDRNRFLRTHDLLLEAGPLPELPASLSKPPPVAVRVLRPLPTSAQPRTRALIAPLAAALALAAGAGIYVATRTSDSILTTVTMHATAAAPGASAVVRVGARDRSGNLPITLRVRGLPALPAGSVYEMYLTDKGRVVGSCGVFNSNGRWTVVKLNAPYRVGEYSGWLIRSERAHRPSSPPLLTTEA